MTAALLGAGAMAADAGAVKIPSSLVLDRITEVSEPPAPNLDTAVYGHLFSKQACLKNRKVVIEGIYNTESGRRPYDIARTGVNGAFSGFGPSTHDGNALVGARLTLKPKDIGTRRHPKTCRGDVVEVVE